MESELVHVERDSSGFDLYEFVHVPPSDIILQQERSERISSLEVALHHRRSLSSDLVIPDYPPTVSSLNDSPTETDPPEQLTTPRRSRSHSPSGEQESESQLQANESIKDAIFDAWNNFKYSWQINLPINFKRSHPVCVLGCIYDAKIDQRFNELKMDLKTRTYFCYRKNFESFSGTAQRKLTTDAGWGCMYRSAQMMMANCLQILYLTRKWKLQLSDHIHKNIVKLFYDDPREPFSIHNLVKYANGNPGEWTGPVSVANAMKSIVQNSQGYPLISEINILVPSNSRINSDEVLRLLSPNDRNESKPLLIILPLWLGGAKSANKVYLPSVQSLLADESCVGLIGGKPKHSMYMVGFQDSRLLAFDPHLCENITTKMSDYHSEEATAIKFEKLDPSCAFGFLLRCTADAQDFLRRVKPLANPPSVAKVPGRPNHCPLFSITNDAVERETEGPSELTESLLRIHHINLADNGNTSHSTDEYVFL